MTKSLLNYLTQAISITIDRLINSSFILLIGLITNFLVQKLIKKTIQKVQKNTLGKNKKLTPRLQTLQGVLNNASSMLIWGILFVMLFSKWGFNILPIITGAGVIGLAVGFGSQTLVRDVVTGFFILLENQFNKGDVIEVVGIKGKVKEINLRTITLESEDGTIHIIPNSQVTRVSKNLPTENKETL